MPCLLLIFVKVLSCSSLSCFSNSAWIPGFARDTKCWCQVVDPTLNRKTENFPTSRWPVFYLLFLIKRFITYFKTSCLTFGCRHPSKLCSWLWRNEYCQKFGLRSQESFHLGSSAHTFATFAFLCCCSLTQTTKSSSVLTIGDEQETSLNFGKFTRIRRHRKRASKNAIKIRSLYNIFAFLKYSDDKSDLSKI